MYTSTKILNWNLGSGNRECSSLCMIHDHPTNIAFASTVDRTRVRIYFD